MTGSAIREQMCRLCRLRSAVAESFAIERAPASVNELPPAGSRPGAFSARLSLWECPGCGHFQLAAGSEPRTWREAVTAAGLSPQMRQERLVQFARMRGDAVHEDLLEIGAGEGAFLSLFNQAGFKARGVEWSESLVEAAVRKGLAVERGHPSEGSLRGAMIGNFASINFLEHAMDPVGMLREIRQACRGEALGLVEVPSFEKDLLLERSHDLLAEHLSYFTARSLRLALELAGFEVLGQETFWGGDDLVAWVRPRPPKALIDWRSRDPSFALFASFCEGAEAVGMWGASHQALTLLGMCEAKPPVAMVADSSPKKQGRMDPAWGIPIVSPDELIWANPAKILIMAAGYSAEVARMLRQRGYAGRAAILADSELTEV